jgi:hypothetical protein
MRQRQASPHTIASYRDTFRLLMQYAQQRLRKAPSQLTMPDMDTPFLGAFLDHLEQKRDNSALPSVPATARVGPEVEVDLKIAYRNARPSAIEGGASVAGMPSGGQPVTHNGPASGAPGAVQIPSAY